MRIFWFFAASYFVAILNMKAQTAFQKKDHYITAGYSLVHLYPTYLEKTAVSPFDKQFEAYGQYSEYTARVYSPINLAYEYGISKHVGLGLSLGYFKSTFEEKRLWYYPTNTITTNETFFLAGLRLNYHFGSSKRFDPYAGLTLGGTLYDTKRHFSYNRQTEDDGLSFAPDVGLSMGLRYYPVKFMAIFAEAGFEHWAVAQVGLVFKLN